MTTVFSSRKASRGESECRGSGAAVAGPPSFIGRDTTRARVLYAFFSAGGFAEGFGGSSEVRPGRGPICACRAPPPVARRCRACVLRCRSRRLLRRPPMPAPRAPPPPSPPRAATAAAPACGTGAASAGISTPAARAGAADRARGARAPGSARRLSAFRSAPVVAWLLVVALAAMFAAGAPCPMPVSCADHSLRFPLLRGRRSWRRRSSSPCRVRE